MQKDIIEQLIAEVERLKGEDLYLALRGQNARLLAVARAARALHRSYYYDVPIADYEYEGLAKALKEVDDLL